MSLKRKLMILTSKGTADLHGDVHQQIGELQLELTKLNQGENTDGFKNLTDCMVAVIQHQEKMKEKSQTGIATGIATLDRENKGFHPDMLIVLAARPGVGKSAIAGQWAVNMAKEGVKVGIISLEMNTNEITSRLVAAYTNTDFNMWFYGNFPSDEYKWEVSKQLRWFTELPLQISDRIGINVYDIKAQAEKMKLKEGLDILIVDYLQLIEPIEGNKNRNREQEVAQISRGLKTMAKQLGITVLVLSQLNREVTKRKGAERYPHLSDLRESGAIEQDADAVIFLHRDWMNNHTMDENGNSTEKQADLVIRKWRNQKSDYTIPLEFEPTKMMFHERKNGFTLLPPEKSYYDKQEDEDAF